MIQNRELTMDDYLGMLRRRAKVILIPAVVATVLGYFAYLTANRYYAKYTSCNRWSPRIWGSGWPHCSSR